MDQNVEKNLVKLCCGKIGRKRREDWVLPKLRGLGKTMEHFPGNGGRYQVVGNSKPTTL